MTEAVGDHHLESIPGAGGANNMWETWKIDGKWASTGSSIWQGSREATDAVLTRETSVCSTVSRSGSTRT